MGSRKELPRHNWSFLIFAGTFALFVTHVLLVESYIYLHVHFWNIPISSFSLLKTLSPHRNNPSYSLMSSYNYVYMESVVESLVSIYEIHIFMQRPINDDRAEREVCLAMNGPFLRQTGPLIKKAIKDIFRSGHL